MSRAFRIFQDSPTPQLRPSPTSPMIPSTVVDTPIQRTATETLVPTAEVEPDSPVFFGSATTSTSRTQPIGLSTTKISSTPDLPGFPDALGMASNDMQRNVDIKPKTYGPSPIPYSTTFSPYSLATFKPSPISIPSKSFFTSPGLILITQSPNIEPVTPTGSFKADSTSLIVGISIGIGIIVFAAFFALILYIHWRTSRSRERRENAGATIFEHFVRNPEAQLSISIPQSAAKSTRDLLRPMPNGSSARYNPRMALCDDKLRLNTHAHLMPSYQAKETGDGMGQKLETTIARTGMGELRDGSCEKELGVVGSDRMRSDDEDDVDAALESNFAVEDPFDDWNSDGNRDVVIEVIDQELEEMPSPMNKRDESGWMTTIS